MLTTRLALLQAEGNVISLAQGLEKECLRVRQDGHIAATPHPIALGSALTHAHITTDYSEALLEFITPPHPSAAQTLQFLTEIHQFVYQHVPNELLWVNSMPHVVDEASIPIAQYGSSNIGRMKHVYRQGLAHRYGKKMQSIAGIHFNFSVQPDFFDTLHVLEKSTLNKCEFINRNYFGLVRNYLRYSWIVPYLFGASPAIDKNFSPNNLLGLVSFDKDTYVAEYGTSLRLSDIGYKNDTQSTFNISYNSLHEYVCGLIKAITTSHPAYEKIGVCENGQFKQLNTNILQIENEYYASIRPKQTTLRCERPTTALKKRGVEYIEVRALDLNPFEPLGINLQQMLFLEVFLMFCLLEDSLPLEEPEKTAVNQNYKDIVLYGRKPGLRITQAGGAIPFSDAAKQLFDKLLIVAELLDKQSEAQGHVAAVMNEFRKVEAVELTPSAQVLTAMRTHHDSFLSFSLKMAKQHAEYFKSSPLDPRVDGYFNAEALQSLHNQRQLETSDTLPFDEFVTRYYSDCKELSSDNSKT